MAKTGNGILFLGLLMYLVFVTGTISYIATNMQLEGIPAGMAISTDYTTIQTGIPLIGDIIDSLAGLTQMTVFTGKMFANVLLLLFWNLPEEYLPFILNVIFIKIPIITLIYLLIEMILP